MALFVAPGLAPSLSGTVNSLLDRDHCLARMPGSGLHRQLKIQWHGWQLAVNIWQTGRVHVQGKGAGRFARLLSLAHASSLDPEATPSKPPFASLTLSSDSASFCESDSPGQVGSFNFPARKHVLGASFFIFSFFAFLFGIFCFSFGGPRLVAWLLLFRCWWPLLRAPFGSCFSGVGADTGASASEEADHKPRHAEVQSPAV